MGVFEFIGSLFIVNIVCRIWWIRSVFILREHFACENHSLKPIFWIWICAVHHPHSIQMHTWYIFHFILHVSSLVLHFSFYDWCYCQAFAWESICCTATYSQFVFFSSLQFINEIECNAINNNNNQYGLPHPNQLKLNRTTPNRIAFWLIANEMRCVRACAWMKWKMIQKNAPRWSSIRISAPPICL